MKFLKVEEVLDIIDIRFKYNFEGKEDKDHLISNKTWTNYVIEFLEEKIDKNEDVKIYEDKITGEKSGTKYREDFVEEVIEYRKKRLKKHLNTDKKTMIDYETIQMFENIASSMNLEMDKDIYNKRIIKTKHEKMEKEKHPEITKEDMKDGRDKLINIIVDQLIDFEKIDYDIREHRLSNFLHYGYADPLDMMENEDGSQAGFKIDAKNYLKESVKKEII